MGEKKIAASAVTLNGECRSARPGNHHTAGQQAPSRHVNCVRARRFVRHGEDVSAAIRSILAEIAAVMDQPARVRLVIDGTEYNTVVRAITWRDA